MKKINIKFIAESAIIAALYVALTWLLAPISYGAIQFRVSEVLVLLVVLNPKFALALILGCFISNTTSSLGWYDMVFGTLATTLAIIPMCFIRKMPIAAIFPVITNGIIVSIELGIAFEQWGYFYGYNVLTVSLGEAVVLYLLGIPLMSALVKNDKICELMELDKDKSIKLDFLNGYSILAWVLFVLSIILFIAYPMYFIESEEGTTNYSMLEFTKNGFWWLVFVPFTALVYSLVSTLLKEKARLIVEIILVIAIIGLHITLGVLDNNCFKNFYYYLYFLFPSLMMIIGLSMYRNELITKNINSSEKEINEE